MLWGGFVIASEWRWTWKQKLHREKTEVKVSKHRTHDSLTSPLTKIVHVPDDIFVFEEHVFIFGLQVIRQTFNVTFVQQVQHQDARHPESNVGQLFQTRHLWNQVFGEQGARVSHAVSWAFHCFARFLVIWEKRAQRPQLTLCFWQAPETPVSATRPFMSLRVSALALNVRH